MNLEQLYGALRAAVPAIVALMVANKWIPGEQTSWWVDTISQGAVAAVTLGSVIWSILKNRKSSQIARVAAMPEVHELRLKGE